MTLSPDHDVETSLSTVLLLQDSVTEEEIIAFLASERSQEEIISSIPSTKNGPHQYQCGVYPHEAQLYFGKQISDLPIFNDIVMYIYISRYVSDNRDIDLNMASEFFAFDLAAMLYKKYKCSVWADDGEFPLENHESALGRINVNGRNGNLWSADQFYLLILKPFYKDKI